MLGTLDLFPSPQVQPGLGRALSEEFVSEFGPPALLTLPMGDERAYDFGWNGNHGTLNGGVTTTASGWGTLGQSWKGNGTTGKLTTSAGFVSNGDFTFSIVSKLIDTVTCSLLAESSTLSTNPLALFQSNENSTNIFKFIWRNDAGTTVEAIDTSSVANDGNYHFWTATRIGQNLTLYRDGAFIATASGCTGTITPNIMTLLALTRNTTGLFSNDYLAFAMSRAGGLTAAQVSTLYSSLLTGEPYRLFAPSVMERFYGPSVIQSPGSFIGGGVGNFPMAA